MGATWAFILIWFQKKWEFEDFQRAVGVDRPIWMEGFSPRFGFAPEDWERAREAPEEVLPGPDGKEIQVGKARKALGALSKVKEGEPLKIIADYLHAVQHSLESTWNLQELVARTMVDNDLTALHYARLHNCRSVVSPPTF